MESSYLPQCSQQNIVGPQKVWRVSSLSSAGRRDHIFPALAEPGSSCQLLRDLVDSRYRPDEDAKRRSSNRRRPRKHCQTGSCTRTRKSTMGLSKVAAWAFIVGAPSLMSVALARAASDCSMSVTLADWGENSTGYIDLTSGGSCQFPIRMRGTVSASGVSQKPAHGKLKRLDVSTFEYEARARYKGSDTFAIRATGQGPTASGSSVITVHATIK